MITGLISIFLSVLCVSEHLWADGAGIVPYRKINNGYEFLLYKPNQSSLWQDFGSQSLKNGKQAATDNAKKCGLWNIIPAIEKWYERSSTACHYAGYDVYFVEIASTYNKVVVGSAKNGTAQWCDHSFLQLTNNQLNTSFREILKDKHFIQAFESTVQQQIGHVVQDIYFYESDKPYYQFTNYWSKNSFNDMNVAWKTSEHYFQALKFQQNSSYWNHIVNQVTADNARVEAGKLNSFVRKDWHLPLSNPHGFVKLVEPPQLDFKTLNNGRYQLYLQNNKMTQAQQYGYNNSIKKDTAELLLQEWQTGKIAAMYQVVKAKFTHVPVLKQLLLNTGNVNLFENATKDDYWGLKNTPSLYIPGLNMLGIVLMRVRDELREMNMQQIHYQQLQQKPYQQQGKGQIHEHQSQFQLQQELSKKEQQLNKQEQHLTNKEQELKKREQLLNERAQYLNNIEHQAMIDKNNLMQKQKILEEIVIETKKLQESLEEKIDVWNKKLVISEDTHQIQSLSNLLTILKQKLNQLLTTILQFNN